MIMPRSGSPVERGELAPIRFGLWNLPFANEVVARPDGAPDSGRQAWADQRGYWFRVPACKGDRRGFCWQVLGQTEADRPPKDQKVNPWRWLL